MDEGGLSARLSLIAGQRAPSRVDHRSGGARWALVQVRGYVPDSLRDARARAGADAKVAALLRDLSADAPLLIAAVSYRLAIIRGMSLARLEAIMESGVDPVYGLPWDEFDRLIPTLDEPLRDLLERRERRGEARGRRAGHQEGRQEGRQDGARAQAAATLERLMRRRFGAVPEPLAARIADAGQEQLDHWLDRVIDARTAEEVFLSA